VVAGADLVRFIPLFGGVRFMLGLYLRSGIFGLREGSPRPDARRPHTPPRA
jgi:hypothetical protein